MKKCAPAQRCEEDGAWHLLETHARITSSRAGKRYKDWLFQRAPEGGDWLRAVEAGAMLMMRDVVRERLRREYAPSFVTSLNREVADSGCTLEDLLPDGMEVVSEIEQRENRAFAKSLAEQAFPSLAGRARIALWARANGFGLHDERVLTWADCSKSVLYEAHRRAVHHICDLIKNATPGEAPSVRLHLARMALDELKEIMSEKIVQEKRAARFFKTI